MEHPKWEKDMTPYLVFSCTKCKQYSYVKTTQKTKKCLRCGRTHQVKKILNKGQIVEGITSAMNKLKELQNKINGASFQVDYEFKVVAKSVSVPKHIEKSLEEKFSLLLDTLSSQYHHFPKYMIQLLASEYHISKEEIPLLIRKSIREGKLSKDKLDYYRVGK
jgi:hypothetical protein